MADSKISALPLDTILTGTENVPVVDGGVNKRTTAQAIANLKEGSDLLSNLLSSEVSITGATTLTNSAFGKMHVCGGFSANYTLNLPPVSGNAGKFIGFRMLSTLTKLVTLDANGGETIDGDEVRVMWANEVAILMCDGLSWTKVAGKSIPMYAKILSSTQQTVNNTPFTAINYQSQLEANQSFLTDLGGSRFNIPRSGRWNINAVLVYEAITVGGDYQVRLNKNSTDGMSGFLGFGQANHSITNTFPVTSVITTVSFTVGDFVKVFAYIGPTTPQVTYDDEPMNTFLIQEIITW